MPSVIDNLSLEDLSSQPSKRLEVLQRSQDHALIAGQDIEACCVIQEYAGDLVTATFKKRLISSDSTTLDFFEVSSGKKFIHGHESDLRFVKTTIWESKANSIFVRRGLQVFLVSTRLIQVGEEILSKPIKTIPVGKEVRV